MPRRNCQTLHAGGNVDAVTVEPFAFDDYVTQVNANAKLI